MPAARAAATIEVMANVERMEDPQIELDKRAKIGSRDDAATQSEDEERRSRSDQCSNYRAPHNTTSKCTRASPFSSASSLAKAW